MATTAIDRERQRLQKQQERYERMVAAQDRLPKAEAELKEATAKEALAWQDYEEARDQRQALQQEIVTCKVTLGIRVRPAKEKTSGAEETEAADAGDEE